ncbi:hypothetical protein J6590_031615 [Homalodisca vitripennis]|nr:hypothetical protein J6590_031615 [Homalodisca vitripennis]
MENYLQPEDVLRNSAITMTELQTSASEDHMLNAALTSTSPQYSDGSVIKKSIVVKM